jgi:hypothetical protein
MPLAKTLSEAIYGPALEKPALLRRQAVAFRMSL